MRSSHRGAPIDAIVSLGIVTCFTPILRSLSHRLGAGWNLDTSRSCDESSILMVSAAAEELDLTLVVSETTNGFTLEEMKADRLEQVGSCETTDQVMSLVVRHIFQVPARLGLDCTNAAAA